MIDLERNSKKEPVAAKGRRTRNIYTPNQKDDFKLSRSKFSDFLTCQRCFYLDRVEGLKPPGTPGWSLNAATDELLKKEFDHCRKQQVPHRLFAPNGLKDVVPFDHPEMDHWRDSLRHGLIHSYKKKKNIILSGGIDDIWQNKITKKLIIVDYKSQAKNAEVDNEEYLNDPYHKGYKIQMDFYAYLLSEMGFEVDKTSYFLVCNARKDEKGFNKLMHFKEYLVPYQWDISWIEEKIDEMITLMDQGQIPSSNPCCNNCAYSNEYAQLLKISNDDFFDKKINLSSLDNVHNKEKKPIKNMDRFKSINKEENNSIENSISEIWDNFQKDKLELKLPYEDNYKDLDFDLLIEVAEISFNNLDQLGGYSVLKKASEINYKNSSNFYKIGLVLKEFEDYKLAIEFLSFAIRINHNKAEYFYERGDIFMLIDKYQEAILDFNKAIEIEPNNPYNYYELGNALALDDNKKGAHENWAKASELGFEKASILLTKNTKIQKQNPTCDDKSNSTSFINSDLEIDQLAEQITVLIYGNSFLGSGVLVKKESNQYTVLTAKHLFKDLKDSQDITIRIFNSNSYIAILNSLCFIENLDLATIKFNSKKNYKISTITSSENIKRGSEIWVTGFPPANLISENIIPMLYPGRLIGKQKKTYSGEELLYSNPTQPGTSGGGILCANGTLVGIHVAASLDTKALEKGIELKSGINMGIPIDYFTEPNKIPTKNSAAYIDSGNEKLNSDDHIGAISDYTQVIEMKPNNAEVYVSRGRAKIYLNDVSGAIYDFNRAIEINPEFYEAYFERAHAKQNSKDNSGAIIDYSKALELNPKCYDSCRNIALNKSKLGDKYGAISEYSKAIEINPKDYTSLLGRGCVKLELGDYTGAIFDMNEIIEINPEFELAYELRADAKMKQGKIKDACSDWRKASFLGSEDADKLFQKHCS